MDKGTTERLYGNYRAKVVDNRDKEKFGRVLIWIPDLMESVPQTEGIWARPANNPVGGRNLEGDADHYYMGTSFIPQKGSWTWVFFEAGNINRPYYFGALDLENTKVLPENQLGTNYEAKWTIFKSPKGRAIVISDDPDDERVEITGKKRLLQNKPTGDTYSVTRIISNQTTILLDEREGQEKILIKTHKGDYIHIDIGDSDLEIQFQRDMHLALGGNLFIRTDGEMHFLSKGGITMSTAGEFNLFAGGRINIETGDEFNRKVAKHSVEQVGGMKITKTKKETFLDTDGDYNVTSGGNINRDASPTINDNSGAAKPAPEISINTIIATPADPEGDRDEETGQAAEE